MDGQQPYTNTLDALNNNKLPVYKVSSTSGATYAYFKNITSNGIHFYTLMDDNTTFYHMDLIATKPNNYYFNMVSTAGNNHICILTNTGWQQ